MRLSVKNGFGSFNMASLFRYTKIPFFFDFFHNGFFRLSSFIFDFEFSLDGSKFFGFVDSGIKKKTYFFLSQFFARVSFSLQLRRLLFTKGFKFLVYNSFSFCDSLTNKFSYRGYFPFSYFNLLFDLNFGLLSKFSFISKRKNFKFARLGRAKDDNLFDLDTHLSDFFHFESYFPENLAPFNIFPFFVTEWSVVNDSNSNLSLFVNSNEDSARLVSTRCHFIDVFFKKFLRGLKKCFLRTFFICFFFLENFYLSFFFFF